MSDIDWKARAEQAERERDRYLTDLVNARTERDALRGVVLRETTARKRVEADLDHSRKTTGKALTEARTRAEQAERERDEALAAHHSAVDDVQAWRDRAERAEADNAALLEVARRYVGADLVVMGSHPGAALLEEHNRRGALLEAVARACRGLGPVTPEVESVVGRALKRLQALEKVRFSVEPTRRLTALLLASELASQSTAEDRALVDACAAADALKGET